MTDAAEHGGILENALLQLLGELQALLQFTAGLLHRQCMPCPPVSTHISCSFFFSMTYPFARKLLLIGFQQEEALGI